MSGVRVRGGVCEWCEGWWSGVECVSGVRVVVL